MATAAHGFARTRASVSQTNRVGQGGGRVGDTLGRQQDAAGRALYQNRREPILIALAKVWMQGTHGLRLARDVFRIANQESAS